MLVCLCVFSYDGEEDDRAIELAFAKQHADKRKEVCFYFVLVFHCMPFEIECLMVVALMFSVDSHA